MTDKASEIKWLQNLGLKHLRKVKSTLYKYKSAELRNQFKQIKLQHKKTLKSYMN